MIFLMNYYLMFILHVFCFPDSSVGKKSTCNARDPVQFLGQEDLLEKGRLPLQYLWASLVAQLVKNPPAMWETLARSLGWEDPLEKGKKERIIIWCLFYMYFRLCKWCWTKSKFKQFSYSSSKWVMMSRDSWQHLLCIWPRNW